MVIILTTVIASTEHLWLISQPMRELWPIVSKQNRMYDASATTLQNLLSRVHIVTLIVQALSTR